jgi:hypothetical protein
VPISFAPRVRPRCKTPASAIAEILAGSNMDSAKSWVAEDHVCCGALWSATLMWWGSAGSRSAEVRKVVAILICHGSPV